jgi:hypothetical protein
MEKQGFQFTDFEEDYMIKKRCIRREFNILDAKEQVACHGLRPLILDSFEGATRCVIIHIT